MDELLDTFADTIVSALVEGVELALDSELDLAKDGVDSLAVDLGVVELLEDGKLVGVFEGEEKVEHEFEEVEDHDEVLGEVDGAEDDVESG